MGARVHKRSDRKVRAGCQMDTAAPGDSILHHHASVCAERKSDYEVTPLEWTFFL